MPNFISVIVLCGIVRILLSPTGMINMLLGTSYNFLTMPEAFRTIYIASGIWQGAGWASIIYTPLDAKSISFSCDGTVLMDVEKYDLVVE